MKHVVNQEESKFNPVTLTLILEKEYELDFLIGLFGTMFPTQAVELYRKSLHGRANQITEGEIRDAFQSVVENIRHPLLKIKREQE